MSIQTTPKLTARQEAEAIEQFGDDLIALDIAFTKLCASMSSGTMDRVNLISGQDQIEAVAEAFRKLGDRMSLECDAAADADTLRGANPLEPDFRRL